MGGSAACTQAMRTLTEQHLHRMHLFGEWLMGSCLSRMVWMVVAEVVRELLKAWPGAMCGLRSGLPRWRGCGAACVWRHQLRSSYLALCAILGMLLCGVRACFCVAELCLACLFVPAYLLLLWQFFATLYVCMSEMQLCASL